MPGGRKRGRAGRLLKGEGVGLQGGEAGGAHVDDGEVVGRQPLERLHVLLLYTSPNPTTPAFDTARVGGPALEGALNMCGIVCSGQASVVLGSRMTLIPHDPDPA